MTPLFLFAPGAGAPSSHPWMQRWRQHLETIGRVVLLDYPYLREGRRRPDPLAQLIIAHRQALTAARREGEPTFLIGKSMGGRVGCHVALEEKVAGVICLGYPLCGAGDRTKLRDQVLLLLPTPILFVQGTRDTLCPLDILEGVRAKMDAVNLLHLVDGGDHSLMVNKRQLTKTGQTQEEIDLQILEAITAFARTVTDLP